MAKFETNEQVRDFIKANPTMNDATLAKKTGRTEGQIRVQKGWITRGVKPKVEKAPYVAPPKKTKEEKDEERRAYQRERNRKKKEAKLAEKIANSTILEVAPTTAVATTEKVEEPNIHAVAEVKKEKTLKVKKEKKAKKNKAKAKGKKNTIKGSKQLKKLFAKIDQTHIELAQYVVKAYPMAKEMLLMIG